MTTPFVSKRASEVPASPIRKLIPYASDAKKRGIKVYHLNIGDPDIETPEVMLSSLKNWNRNPVSYCNSQGQPELLSALLWYYHKLGFTFLKTEDLQVTTGGSEGIMMAMFATCQPDDEILAFEPLYTNYNSCAAITQVRINAVPTKAGDGFHLPSQKEIEKKITKKTKAIIYCNPNNPTGTVYTKKEIEMLVAIAKKYGLFLIADEVYREFCYDGKEHFSLLSYSKKIPKQAILLDSLSKRYSICGARIGILSSLNQDIMTAALRYAQARLSSGFIDQIMAAELTKIPASYTRKVQKEYAKRRDVLYQGLKKIPGVSVPYPEGAFYCIVTLPVNDSEDFCKYLLTDFHVNKETVMLAPAGGFYASKNAPKNQVRIAYVLNTEAIKKSLLILKKALEKYSGLFKKKH